MNGELGSCVVAATMLFASQFAFADEHCSAPAAHRSIGRYEITVATIEADGTKIVQTRSLGAAAASTFFSGDGTSKEATDRAPPLPNPPLPGSVPVSTTRADYPQEAQGRMRDTSYGRVPGG